MLIFLTSTPVLPIIQTEGGSGWSGKPSQAFVVAIFQIASRDPQQRAYDETGRQGDGDDHEGYTCAVHYPAPDIPARMVGPQEMIIRAFLGPGRGEEPFSDVALQRVAWGQYGGEYTYNDQTREDCQWDNRVLPGELPGFI